MSQKAPSAVNDPPFPASAKQPSSVSASRAHARLILAGRVALLRPHRVSQCVAIDRNGVLLGVYSTQFTYPHPHPDVLLSDLFEDCLRLTESSFTHTPMQEGTFIDVREFVVLKFALRVCVVELGLSIIQDARHSKARERACIWSSSRFYLAHI